MPPMLSPVRPLRESTKDYRAIVHMDTPFPNALRQNAPGGRVTIHRMDPVLARIQRVTEELNELEQDLNKIGTAGGKGPVPPLDEQARLKLVSDLQVAGDNIRRFLWAYIE